MSLAVHLPGSNDRRVYVVRGVSLNVVRGADSWSVGFNGGGRDGDFVVPDAPEPKVLNEVLSGIGGLDAVSPTDIGAPDEATLAQIEERLASASGGPSTITRTGDGSLELALALLDVPVSSGMKRSTSLRGGWMLSIDVPREGDALATPWAWGKDPGPWLSTTLEAMGVRVAVHSGVGHAAVLAIPRERVRELLVRALESPALGPAQLQLTDVRCEVGSGSHR